MNVFLTFSIVGALIIIGFLGDFLFKKKGIPDVMIYIGIGALLGPVYGIVDAAVLGLVAPIIGPLALVIILLESGLNLNMHRVLSESPRALVLAVSGFLISMLIAGFFLDLALGWGLMKGLLLGAILAGTSSAVVLTLIGRMKVPDKVKTVLSLESVFNDPLVIVIGITLLQIITSTSIGVTVPNIAQTIASAFSIGGMVGLFMGLIWLRVMVDLKGHIYDDILTIGVVLLLYALVEYLGGSGAIFALVFGIILGNGAELSRFLKMKETTEASETMKKFMAQISFLLRTFFFVFLGLILIVGDLTIVAISIGLSLLLLAGRYPASWLSTLKSPLLKPQRGIITVMLPKGLAAAVVAQVVVLSGIPEASAYTSIVTLVVLSTTIIAVFGVILYGRAKPSIQHQNP